MKVAIIGSGPAHAMAISALKSMSDVMVVSAEQAQEVFKDEISIPIRNYHQELIEVKSLNTSGYFHRKSDDQPWKKPWKR